MPAFMAQVYGQLGAIQGAMALGYAKVTNIGLGVVAAWEHRIHVDLTVDYQLGRSPVTCIVSERMDQRSVNCSCITWGGRSSLRVVHITDQNLNPRPIWMFTTSTLLVSF